MRLLLLNLRLRRLLLGGRWFSKLRLSRLLLLDRRLSRLLWWRL
jgi:hypothetical protein